MLEDSKEAFEYVKMSEQQARAVLNAIRIAIAVCNLANNEDKQVLLEGFQSNLLGTFPNLDV